MVMTLRFWEATKLAGVGAMLIGAAIILGARGNAQAATGRPHIGITNGPLKPLPPRLGITNGPAKGLPSCIKVGPNGCSGKCIPGPHHPCGRGGGGQQ
jgi:hypothetical protein